MPAPTIHKATAFEDSGVSLMARILGTASTAIAQADISTITYGVKATHGGSTATIAFGTSLSTTEVVFDTLQTDARWTRDTTGYNFRVDVPSSALPDGNKKYRAEVKFTPASGQPFHAAWDIETVDLLGS